MTCFKEGISFVDVPRWLGRSGPLLLASLVCSCSVSCRKGDAPPPAALGTAVDDDGTQSQTESSDEDDEAGRDLWFAGGPGRAAIVARERQDHEAAVRHLDSLLAQKDLSLDDRGVAELLRGLEDLTQENYEAAARRFAVARKAPALRDLDVRLRWLEAQARLDAGQPEIALSLVGDLSTEALVGSPLRDDVWIVQADASARTDDTDKAVQAYESYLAAYPGGKRRFEVMAKLARILANAQDVPKKARAVELYEALLLESPLSDYGEEADQVLPELRKAAGVSRTGKERDDFERSVAIARAEAALDRRRYRTAIKDADQLLRKAALDGGDRCRLLYVKGSAIFKQRKRADARPVFQQAAKACQSAGKAQVDYEVRSRYQAARGLYAEGKYAKAGEAFESLATDRADHSYADDAWVLAGESWTEHGDRDRARTALQRAHALDGDMKHEARRRLLLMAFADDDPRTALALVDEALAKPPADPTKHAKLLYFRGRALQKLGKTEEARAAWLDCIAADPLDYPALQALNRLRELGKDAFAAGVAKLRGQGTEGVPPLQAKTPGARRAQLLARLGLGEAAAEELAHAEVDGWPAVAVLDQAGLYAEGQRLLGRLGSTWRAQAPSDADRRKWELAHPRPFAKLIAGYEQTHSVPGLLAFAVMQTESRFDPGVTSWAGARGLIQLMPSTAESVAKSSGREYEPTKLYDPATNLDLGMLYLGRLVGRFGGSEAAVALAVPSYNAGAGAVDRWLGERGQWDLDLFVEAIPYDETRHYTQSVLGRWWAYRWLYGDADPERRVPMLPLTLPRD